MQEEKRDTFNSKKTWNKRILQPITQNKKDSYVQVCLQLDCVHIHQSSFILCYVSHPTYN